MGRIGDFLQENEESRSLGTVNMARRIIFILVCALIALVATPFVQPYLKHNDNIILIIITVFTVFAGFLVGIITIIGDPALIPDGSWRLAELSLEQVEKRLVTHVSLFMLYLLTIVFLFIAVILEAALSDKNIVKIWVERLYLFFGMFSFLLTFALPSMLIRVQKARVEAEVERRRRDAGIISPPGN